MIDWNDHRHPSPFTSMMMMMMMIIEGEWVVSISWTWMNHWNDINQFLDNEKKDASADRQ